MIPHSITVAPVGWGFLAIHRARDRGMDRGVVIDGGCMPQCFHSSWTLVRLLMRRFSLMGKWVWILSHLDYDHFSLTQRLIEQGILSTPKVVILPASYGYPECRESIAMLLALAEAIAYILKVPPPKSKEIIYLLDRIRAQGGKLIGVFAGIKGCVRGYSHELSYLFVWPEQSYVRARCSELSKELEKKIERICKGDEVCLNKARRVFDELRKWIERAEEEVSIYEAIDFDELIESTEPERERMGREKRGHDEPWGNRSISLSLEGLFSVGSLKLREPELLYLTRNVLNVHSLAFAISSNTHIWYDICPSIFLKNYVYACVCCRIYLLLRDRVTLFYPGDLTDYELDRAIENLSVYYSRLHPLIAIAPHHGNARSSKWQCLEPALVYVPRCDRHIPSEWITKFNIDLITRNATMLLISQHDLGLNMCVRV